MINQPVFEFEMSEQHIFLVGPMGVGKTTIGKQLASLLHRPFVDIDAEIETRCGADIQWIFDICLLYTSPSPRDGLLSRMPSSA